MKAIIMAGGEGARLRPLTCDRPKPLVPVANKPVMEYAIELLRLYGIKDIGVTLQYLPQAIVDYFGDGSSWDVNLHYFVEDSPLGTAGSVKNAEEFLDEAFIVVSGDALTDFNLAQAIDCHQQRKAVATLVLTTVANPLEYGVVITGEQGRVVKFLEKPGWGEVFSDQVNTGIYVLEPDVLSLIPRGQMFDFSKDLFPELLARREALFATVLEGYWCDIGNLEQYWESHRAVLEGRVKVTPPAVYQGQGIWLGQGVEIHQTARLEGPILLGDYCRIGPGAEIGPYTVLGHNVQVKERAGIKRSVVWDGCYLGQNSQLRGAVLCQRVTVETGASVFEGAVVGDRSRIERDVTVKPEVKIWPHKRLGRGTVQYESLVWGSGSKKNLFGSLGIPGPLNREITPEVAAKLGAAYGSSVRANKKIGISYDGQQAIPMLKSAFLSGLLSTGVHGLDLGILPFPVLRYAVNALGLEGGVHIALDLEDANNVWFRFVNEQGIVFNRNQERKLENIFVREDFRRAGMEEMGLTYPLSNVDEIYSNYVLDQIDRKRIRDWGFKVVVGTVPGDPLAGLLSRLFNRVGIEQVSGMTGYASGEQLSPKGVSGVLEELAEAVVAHRAHLGAWLDPHGEKLILVDEKGQILDENLFQLLVASIVFQANPGAKVAVPVTAPQAVEVLAEKFDGQVIRTKTRASQLMEILSEPGFRYQQGDYPQILLQFDAVLGLLKILDFMARGAFSLSALTGEIPRFYMEVQSTPCPWEAKGQVMRRLIEEHGNDVVELVDGIKIYQDQGWALVLPDADEPVYRIYSEGFSQEAAAELAAFYAERIQHLLQRRDKQPLS
ncbi:MAG: NTP transferase domain-containing protein [Clostridia bacterium]|nr:NTP transferase domain-containing protein [Clostridia bacterium]